jgi:hypothetical protein
MIERKGKYSMDWSSSTLVLRYEIQDHSFCAKYLNKMSLLIHGLSRSKQRIHSLYQTFLSPKRQFISLVLRNQLSLLLRPIHNSFRALGHSQGNLWALLRCILHTVWFPSTNQPNTKCSYIYFIHRR